MRAQDICALQDRDAFHEAQPGEVVVFCLWLVGAAFVVESEHGVQVAAGEKRVGVVAGYGVTK